MIIHIEQSSRSINKRYDEKRKRREEKRDKHPVDSRHNPPLATGCSWSRRHGARTRAVNCSWQFVLFGN